MHRDNVLYLVVGTLVGFIAGYVMQEAMMSRQPAPPGAVVASGPSSAAGSPSPGVAPGSPGSDGQPAMAEVQRLSARVAENPDDVEALRGLANLNYDISNWQRAAELYERYLELEPGDLDVITDLGATYRFLGRSDDALARFKEVRERAPSHWQARYNEILVLAFDLEDLEAARSAMAELLKLQPDNTNVNRLAEELEKRSQGA